MSQSTERLSIALAGRYKILRRLGEGGMATVYLAEDLKHERQVALKLLRPELAAVLGADRFIQEIKTTANLQHPHILPLFDSGTAGGGADGQAGDGDPSAGTEAGHGMPCPYLYYVMPFIDGETLRDKLDRETQLGIDEAVKITTEVADALDYAHRQGVIHRDIKPENILLHDGRPMVADFGIALALSAAAGGRMTETGLSLGTPHYMSPEQATAEKDLTNRADIYSLGSVLYEMLTGDPPHTGSSAQQIIMKIVTDEARPVSDLRKSVPPNVAAATAKSLEKLPADRFESAGAFAEALATPGFTTPSMAAAATKAPPKTRTDWRLVSLAAGLGAMTALAAWALWRPQQPPPVARYHVMLPTDQRLGGLFARIALTPDGSRLVYVGGQGSQTSIWVRKRDELDPNVLAGTEGASGPFVSPDGESVGFFSGGELKVASLRGGPPATIADTLVGRGGGSWGSDGFIYAARSRGGLLRVRSSGGTPQEFTRLDSTARETEHILPDVLPNGRGVLFSVRHGSSPIEATIAVAETATGAYRILVRGVYAKYAASGHLLYVTADGNLMAVPFDQDAMIITGDPTAMVGGVGLRVLSIPDLAIAQNGTLMYTGGGVTQDTGGEPVWVSRDGRAEPIAPGWTDAARNLALSSDGSQIAVALVSLADAQLWVRQLARGTASKLTFAGSRNDRPTWTPDGQSLAFVSDRRGDLDLFLRRADGTADAEVLFDATGPLQEVEFTRDGVWMIYREGAGAASNLYARRIRGDSAVIPLAATDFQETEPNVSPDGRWLAYVSDETGGSEVYVRPFPNVESGKWLVSKAGGTAPLWAPDGRELFYRNGADDMLSVEVDAQTMPPTGRETVLFSARPYRRDLFHRRYDVSRDGRFAMIRSGSEQAADLQIIVVENFFEELKERAGL